MKYKNIRHKGVILLIGAFFIMVTVLFGVNHIYAQSIDGGSNMPSDSGNQAVFLQFPETENVSNPPNIWGTTNFSIRFAGVDFSTIDIENFVIDLYPEPSFTVPSAGQMYVSSFEQDLYEDYVWHLRVDTNDFANGLYYVGISILTTDGQTMNFYHGYNNLPFGPVHINNQHHIASPEKNSVVQGENARITGFINGSVDNVVFDLYASDNLVETFQVDDADITTDDYQQYLTQFDSTKFDNGDYTLNLSFTTVSGNYISNFDQTSFIISNGQSGINPPKQCENPQWDCDDWPTECPSSGVMTRQCVSTNCDPQITQTENQSCIFTPPSPNCTYECDDWSACTATGIKTRTCTTTTCETTTEQETCTYNVPNNPDGTNTDTPNNNESDNNDITNPQPLSVVTMQYPGEGDVVTGDIVLKAVTDINVSEMEFFYKSVNVNLEEFIGSANISSNNSLLWQRVWNTDQMPNGEYYVYARATMADGRRNISDYIIITIDHEFVNTIPQNNDQVYIPPSNDISSDSDGDGVDDLTEKSLRTDPNKPEDADIYQPLVDKALAEGKITNEQANKIKTGYFIEQPKTTKLNSSNRLKVVKVENISPSIGKNNLVISGQGPVNAVLKLYIYSDPIVVTIKTDASGNFTYTLDKNLLDGEHEIYVTINDDTGKITEQSAPLSFFVRRAQAVTEEEYLRGDVNIASGSDSVINKYVIPAVITVVALVLIIIGIFLMKRKQKNIV